jgi:signal transduction histidine kinase/CheY-like chemotaxis protein/ligand-binding sensor domain-containing protein
MRVKRRACIRIICPHVSNTNRFGLVVALLLFAVPAFAQGQPSALGRHPEEGRPFVRVYTPDDYGAGPQNWAILFDKRNVLHVGGTGGVLQYDGASWRLIDVANGQTVRSLAQDDQGRIYVGSVSELGYLAPNAVGELRYVSLLDKVPPAERTFTDVWRTYVTPDGVYYQTVYALFRWANGQMRVWKPADRFGRVTYLNGRLILPQPGVGLTELVNDELRTLPGTAQFGNEVYPVLLPFDDTRFLIGTRADGFFLYDGATAAAFPTDFDSFLKRAILYRGTVLPDGSYALATTSGGVAIMDRQGHLLQEITAATGLPADQTYYVTSDRTGGLWVGTGSGVARVETPSPVSFFDERDGVGSASDAARFRGRLYISGQNGIVYLQPAVGASPARFLPVRGIANQTWQLLETKPSPGRPAQLLAAASDGLFAVDGDAATVVQASVGGSLNVATILQSTIDPDRLWVGLFNGQITMRWGDGRWIDEGRLPLTDQVRSLVETKAGVVWAGTQTTGVIRVVLDRADAPGARKAELTRFGTAHGLPVGGVSVSQIDGVVWFSTLTDRVRYFRFDDTTARFVEDRTFDVVRERRFKGGFGPKQHADGSVLVNVGFETAVMHRRPDGTYSVDTRTFSRFNDLGLNGDYLDPDGVIWFAASGGRVLRYDPKRQSALAVAPPVAIVRRVTVNGTVTFGGDMDQGTLPELPPSSRSVRFEFAAPSFGHESATEYQSRLEGLDADWSPWTTESRRDYTNLGFGRYTLRLRARDYTGQSATEAIYPLVIQAPWYRTWWAYLLALLGLASLGFAVDRLQRRRVVAKERSRAEIAEASLRAEAAEALAQSESAGKRNIEALSEIGREITASLDFETIFDRLYERVNQLADAQVFGVGLYHPDRKQIEYRLAIENGKRYAPYTRDASDRDQFPVWCIEHRAPVFLNDVGAEYGKYLTHYDEQRRTLEDGSLSRPPQSIIYLPLVSKDKVLGIITIQSFNKHAYTEHHLNVMQNLAAYTSIALDNASAYRQLNEQENENRRLFEEAQQARATAEEADAAKSAFLSTVSHELRTPLTSVLGFAKIIKKRLEERIFPLIHTDDRRILQTMQQVQENLKVVVGEGERLTKLIDDVLDLAKIEAGKLEWHMDRVTIPDVIDHATAATASLFEQKGLHLVKQMDADLPAVTGDRDRLIQVVINLISNAVKFTDAGSITCRAARRGGEIVVSITDTGLGIAPADQPKVFERFKQVGDTLTDKPKGTGLGLPICREIVEHHGGRIWVESEPGRGSTFSFALPLAGAAADAGGPVELAALIRQLRDHVVVSTPRTADRKPRILVVDDEANIRDLLTQEFTDAGYHVNVAVNGRDAIASVRRERPDLIVLDVMMPEMNGFDVAAVLKNDPATLDIPIVILSIVQDRDRGFRLGVDRYLTKPIDTDLLFREVGTLIEQKKSRKHVLVVDEDATTVKTLTEVLKTRGYSVSEARETELVERAKALQPDIIMLNSVSSTKPDMVQMLRFEKGLENVLFLVYQ